MSNKKEALIAYIDDLLNRDIESNEFVDYWNESFHAELMAYIQPKSKVTDSGNKILTFMFNQEEENLTAKTIAEGLFLSSRSVSGAMRKLVNDGFIVRQGNNPVIYSLTEYAKQKLTEEE